MHALELGYVEGVFINKGRFNVDNLAPREAKTVDFTFDVRPEYKGDTAKVELTVYDSVLHDFVTDKLSFAVVDPRPAQEASGLVTVATPSAQLLGGADKDAPLVGTAEKGAAFKLTGVAGDFFRVELDGRPGYIAKAQATRGDGAAPAKLAFTPEWDVSPPRLTVSSAAGLVEGNTIKLTGSASDEDRVADVFVFVSNRQAKIDRRKVFYRSNRNGQNRAQQAFDADIPVWRGTNVITVVARESTQVQASQTVVVQKREPRAVAQQTHAQPQAPLEPGKSPRSTK